MPEAAQVSEGVWEAAAIIENKWNEETVEKAFSFCYDVCKLCVCVFYKQQAYDQKNIRRRVYDALNVLMAMNIISKEKKEIRWIGLPTNSAQECRNLEVGSRV